MPAAERTPTCPRSGGLARQNILMFGDWGWLELRTAGQAARQADWLAGHGSASRPLVIELGAGTAIPSVRHFSHQVIHDMGGRLIRINPAEAAVPTGLDVGLPLGALAGLEGIAALLGTP